MKSGPRIQEWNHGIIRIAFLILKSLKTEPLEQISSVVEMVPCISRPGLPLTPCLKHFLMRPIKQAIRLQMMSMDSNRKVLESSTETLKMEGDGLHQMHICILF